MNTQKSSSLRIEIPRADYNGMWHDFRQENEPFFAQQELDRIEKLLCAGHSAEHQCHTNGSFLFVATK